MALSRLSLHKHIRRLQDLRSNRCKRHLLGWLAPVLCTKRCESRINSLSSFS